MLNVIEIKDFNAPELDIYARCTEARLLNKDHPEEGMFIAESPKVIGRALDAGYEPLSVLVEKKQMEENEETSQIMNRFDDTKVSIFTADFEVLTKLTGFKLTRGMLCAMRRKPLRKFQDLCDGINRIAILENVQNPTNVEFAPRKIVLPKELEDGESFPVRRHQIDTNEHVNNCQYIQMAIDVVPECERAGQIRVEYKKSAVMGDIIYPKMAVEEQRKIVELCDAEGNPYAVVEFKEK